MDRWTEIHMCIDTNAYSRSFSSRRRYERARFVKIAVTHSLTHSLTPLTFLLKKGRGGDGGRIRGGFADEVGMCGCEYVCVGGVKV